MKLEKLIPFDLLHYFSDYLLCLDIENIYLDSRNITEGSLFFAFKGKKFDGKNFIQNAFKNKAKLVICESEDCNKDIKNNVVFLKKEICTRILFFSLKTYYSVLPDNISAVTGTNGKTSVVEFTRKILDLVGIKSASIGTLGVKSSFCSLEYVNDLTTPDIATLYKTLYYLKKKGINYVIMETSSIAIDQNRIAGINFNSLVFTSFSQDHLDYHKNIKNYFNAKIKLFYNNPSAIAIINKHNKESNKILKKISNKYILYGRNTEIRFIRKKNKFFVKVGNLISKTAIKFKEEFSRSNILAALSVIIHGFKIEYDKIKIIIDNLNKIENIKGRVEKIAQLNNGASVYIDFAHTPEAIDLILRNFRIFTKKKLIILFGCGGSRDKLKRPIMGKIASDLADLVIITSDNPRYEEPSGIIDEIAQGCSKNNFIKIVDRKLAIKKAIELLDDDDLLIVAGKGHEKFQIIEDKKIPFDEKGIIEANIKLQKINKIFEILVENNPFPKTELNYTNNYTLLVAVVLSAQSTDKIVNRATEKLFKIAKSPEEVLILGKEKLKSYINIIGLYNAKAENIINLSKILIKQYDSNVPDNFNSLVSLPGVGRKTANVVLNCAFGKETMPVDTHVFRVSNRLGIINEKNVLKAELSLVRIIPKKWMQNAHHLLVLHGRYICKSRNPKCNECLINDYCSYKLCV